MEDNERVIKSQEEQNESPLFSNFLEPQGCQIVASLPVVMIPSLVDTFCGLLEEQEKIYADFDEEVPQV